MFAEAPHRVSGTSASVFLVQYVGQVFENTVDAGIVRLKVKDADVPGSPHGRLCSPS